MVVSEILAAIPVNPDEAVKYLRSLALRDRELVLKHVQQLKAEGEAFEDLEVIEQAQQLQNRLVEAMMDSRLSAREQRQWKLSTKTGEVIVKSHYTDDEARDIVRDRIAKGEIDGDFPAKLVALSTLSPVQLGWLHFYATKTAPQGNYIGQVGRRVKVQAKITRVIPRESRFGTQTVVGMTEVGTDNEMVWFASGYPNLHVGDLMDYEVLVKEHSVYNNHKQTVVTRCKIIPKI